MNAVLFAGILLCPFLSLAACLYLANGQLVPPDSLKKSLFPQPQPRSDDDAPQYAKASLFERKNTLQQSRWLRFLWVLGTVGGAMFFVVRQLSIADAPALNFKLLALFYLFFAAAVIDGQLYIIPNMLVSAAAVLWLLVVAWSVLAEKNTLLFSLLYSLIGFSFGGGALFVCRVLMKNSLGFGDVKIMAVTGAVCGFYKTFNILFYGLLICSVYSICLLLLKKADRSTEVPLAPFLFAGLVAANLIAA